LTLRGFSTQQSLSSLVEASWSLFQEQEGYVPLDLQSHMTRNTKLLILNSRATLPELFTAKNVVKAAAEAAEDHGVFVLSDEVYEKIILWG